MWTALAWTGVALLALYLLLIAVLLWRRPDEARIRSLLRLLPDTVRLVRALARDPRVPRRARLALWLLLGYLLLPVDLVPDFIPVLGHADDAIVVILVLRFVVRAAGPEVVRDRWPGPEDGLRAVMRAAGIPPG